MWYILCILVFLFFCADRIFGLPTSHLIFHDTIEAKKQCCTKSSFASYRHSYSIKSQSRTVYHLTAKEDHVYFGRQVRGTHARNPAR